MTTSPKAQKYRIRREAPVLSDGKAITPAPRNDAQSALQTRKAPTPAQPRAQEQTVAKSVEQNPEQLFEPQDDGFGDEKFATAQGGTKVLAKGEKTLDEEISEIRAEGLTGRQLRLARRMAQKHGIEATSDFEAVLLLRRRGVNPFERSNIVAMVKAQDPAEVTSRALARTDGAGADARVQLPQTVKPGQVPSTELAQADHRAAQILQIQTDIAKRRRRKLLLLATRLAFFVFLPTLIAAYYYYAMATPMYATKSAFVIQKAEGMGQSGLGSLFSGTQLATNQDSVTVQSYLQSRDAMLRLDRDVGFKKVFENPDIDPLQRLPKNASDEQAYKLYQKMVQIGYDPSEGIVKMEVIAPTPALIMTILNKRAEFISSTTARDKYRLTAMKRVF